MALFTCKDASFYYEGNTAVSGLNFQVLSGDYLCIVGENGSGKSTLIKGLLRLKSPRQGSVFMGDGLKLNEIGYLPQQMAAKKDFPASAYEVIISGRLGSRGILPFYSKMDKAVAEKNIKLLDIDSLRNRCYCELSRGQQQQVLLARALCSAKRALLLDEPAAGLDPSVTQEFYTLINAINSQTGLTVIMVSHDIINAVKYASHILQLSNRQVFFGKTEDYLTSDAGKVYLGMGGVFRD